MTGTDDVFAAGDGTTFAIKQGGIAAQQADAVARAIAGRAGADVDRAALPPGAARQAADRQPGEVPAPGAWPEARETSASTLSDHTLWWPPTKVAAPYLSPYLEQLDEGRGRRPAAAPGRRRRAPMPAAGHGQGDPSGGIELIGR